jgi:DNA-directed RNA polymerase specialized sigma24 family protein
MFIPATQRRLLKRILEDFQVSASIDDTTLGGIYQYVFGPEAAPIDVVDAGLLDTVLALRDIAEMEQLTSLEGIIAFFQAEDTVIDQYMKDISSEITAAIAAEDNEADMSYAEEGPVFVEKAVAVRPALSRYFISTEQHKEKHFAEVFQQQIAWLHKLFYTRLHQGIAEREAVIKDCIQEVAVMAWSIYRKPVLGNVSVEHLIQVSAEQVLANYKRGLQKDIILVPLEEISKEIPLPSNEISYEQSDFLLRYLERYADESSCMVFRLRLEGYTTNEIADRLKIPRALVYKRMQRHIRMLRKHISALF